MSDFVIRVENLSKRYTISHQNGKRDGLRHAIHDAATAPLRWLFAQSAKSKAQSVSNNNGGNPESALSQPTSRESEIRNQRSDSHAPTSDLRPPISGLLPLTSDLRSLTSDLRPPISGLLPLTSDLRPLASEDFWALKGVSFEVKRGEVLGIIGRNGAGKTTLLKILSRITEPTEGRVRIRGRVASLLEVGTGFHPELTGRENIFLNGAILGMSREEIKRKFDQIVDFSGVERFIDTPVKRYSSGMYVRLAFAVAAHLEPEILIVDEVLAVGDFEFQKRCLGKMNEVASSGRTVLFVSHNMAAVEGLCSQGIFLDQGHVSFLGSANDAISKYVCSSSDLPTCDINLKEHPHRTVRRIPVFSSLRLTDDSGNLLSMVRLGKPVTFELELDSVEPLHQARIGIHLHDVHGRRVMTCHSAYQTKLPLNIQGRRLVRCRLPSCRLMPGRYSIVLGLAAANENIDRIEPAMEFEVVPVDIYGTGKLPPTRDGVFVPETEWSFECIDTSDRLVMFR